MDERDKRLLGEVQRRFPLEPEPYRALAERLSLSEEEVLERLKSLKQKGILRQISAIFNPQALGYKTTLVAAAIPEGRLPEATEVINSYPGVSHNYLRNHHYNIWFTIAVPPGESLEEKVPALLTQAGAEKYLLLPIKRVFHIAVVHDLGENNTLEEDRPASSEVKKDFPLPDLLTISLVRLTQDDLPRCQRPFSALAEKAGLSEEELLEWIKKGLETGLIRRFAGLVRHTKAGVRGNIMVAWKVPEDKLEEVGKNFPREKKITHCYERKSYPHWPYNLYTMVHDSDQKKALETVKNLASRFHLREYLPLVTLKELKKTRLKLFW